MLKNLQHSPNNGQKTTKNHFSGFFDISWARLFTCFIKHLLMYIWAYLEQKFLPTLEGGPHNLKPCVPPVFWSHRPQTKPKYILDHLPRHRSSIEK